MTSYLIHVFDKKTHYLIDTMVFLSWRKAQKYLEENIPKWAELDCYANLGGEPIHFRYPKEEK